MSALFGMSILLAALFLLVIDIISLRAPTRLSTTIAPVPRDLRLPLPTAREIRGRRARARRLGLRGGA